MDRDILRELVQRYVEVCQRPVQRQRRDLWRAHNSLKRTAIPIYVRAVAWQEMPQSQCHCQDEFFRTYENELRYKLFWATMEDDSIFELWIAVAAALIMPGEGLWGLQERWTSLEEPGTAKKYDPPIKEEQDAQRMVAPRHAVDEEETRRRMSRMQDAVGDLITVCLDRGPAWRMWSADISSCLGALRGIEQIMWDIMDRPEWLHGVLAFMRDGILASQEQAERAGDWRLCDHQNQAMPYAEELPDPSSGSGSVKRKQLWNFCASQETTLIGPGQFDEFMLQYQIPIMANYGLSAYGCCEDLTAKIPLLRKIPNLRRIAVSPMANAAKCAEQIGSDYVMSYRPSPADMVGYGFSPDRVREILRRDLTAAKRNNCIVDITLKDVETVERDPTRVRKWVRITREVIEEVG